MSGTCWPSGVSSSPTKPSANGARSAGRHTPAPEKLARCTRRCPRHPHAAAAGAPRGRAVLREVAEGPGLLAASYRHRQAGKLAGEKARDGAFRGVRHEAWGFLIICQAQLIQAPTALQAPNSASSSPAQPRKRPAGRPYAPTRVRGGTADAKEGATFPLLGEMPSSGQFDNALQLGPRMGPQAKAGARPALKCLIGLVGATGFEPVTPAV